MCHGSGALSSLFLLVIPRGCGASIAGAPTLATLGAGSDGTAECASECRTRVGRSSDQDYTAGPNAPAGWKTWRSSWTSGGHSRSREVRQMGRRREIMTHLELRDESLRGSHRSGAVDGHDECRNQYGCAEQRNNDRTEKGQECSCTSSWSCCPREGLWIATARLGHGVATSLSCVVFEKQHKTCYGRSESSRGTRSSKLLIS